MDTESPIPATADPYDSDDQFAASLDRVTSSVNRLKRLLHRVDHRSSSPRTTHYSTPDRPAGMGAPMSIHLQSMSSDSGSGGESSGYSSGLNTPSTSGTLPTRPSSNSSNSNSSSRMSHSGSGREWFGNRSSGLRTPSTSGTPPTRPSSNSSSSNSSRMSYSGSGGESSGYSSGLSTPSASGTSPTRPSSSSSSRISHSGSGGQLYGNRSPGLRIPSASGTPPVWPNSSRISYSGSRGASGTSSTSHDAHTSSTVHSASPSTNTTTATTIATTVASSGSSNQSPSGHRQSTGGGSSSESLSATPPNTSGGGHRRRHAPKTKCVQKSAEFGYDCRWVGEPPYSLICPICLSIARRPRQRNCCGSIYCTRCLLMYTKQSTYTAGKAKECPNCRRPSTDFSDRRAELEINQLMVSCDNTENGCQWTGELSHLKYHVNECGYVLVDCTECGHSVLRNNYMAHRQTCLEKKKKMQQPKPTPPKTILAQPVFKMEGYSRHKESGTPWYSPPFYLHPVHNYKMCVGVSFFKKDYQNSYIEKKVMFSLHVMKGEDDNKLSWPLKLSVTFTLLNQHHDGQHYINTASFQAEQVTEGDRNDGCVLMEFKNIPHDRTLDLWFYQNQNDTLYFKIAVQYNDDCGTPLPWLSPVIN